MAAKTARPFPDRGSKLVLGFGLVAVPVQIKPLAESVRPISGKGMCPVHGPTLNQQAVCSRGTDHEHVIENDAKLIGYPHPHDPTRYVHVDPGVVKALQEPRTGSAQIEAMVDVDEIDPGYLSKAYMVWPQPGGEAAFALLATVLRDEGKAAACTAVLTRQTQSILFRWSEHFGCVLAHVVQFEQMIRYADVQRVADGMETIAAPSPQLVEMATTVFESLQAEFRPGDAQDTITPKLEAAIIAADDGEVYTIEVESEVPAAPAEDLMALLQGSLPSGKKAKAPRKKAAA